MKLIGRRQRLFVDKLQFQLLAINMIYTVAMVFVFVLIIFGPLVVTVLGESSITEEKIAAADQMLQLHRTIWPAVIVVMLLFSLHSLLYTHRISGPLYSCQRTLIGIGEGDLRGRARIRTKDYLKTHVEVINVMIDGLSHRVRAVHEASEQARRTAQQLVPAGCLSDPVERSAVVERLGEELDTLATTLNGFQLCDWPDPPVPQSEGVARESVRAV